MAMAKLLHDLTLADIEDTRVPNPKAIYKHLQRIVKTQEGAANLWTRISQELLAPSHPFALHRLLYRSAFSNWNNELHGPPPAWTPTL